MNSALWEYTHSTRLAEDEADYFVGHPMHEQDALVLDGEFVEPGRLVDLGCGIGRHAERFARRGFEVAAVDLSRPMLGALARRTSGLPLLAVEANLCRLACLPDRSFDYALSMFSTLGMIRGEASRARALAETARVLKPGGRLAIPRTQHLARGPRPPGPAWLARELARSVVGGKDIGDRRFTYRGVVGMEVHLYRWSELRRELRRAGFRIERRIAIGERGRPVDPPPVAPALVPRRGLAGLREAGVGMRNALQHDASRGDPRASSRGDAARSTRARGPMS